MDIHRIIDVLTLEQTRRLLHEAVRVPSSVTTERPSVLNVPLGDLRTALLLGPAGSGKTMPRPPLPTLKDFALKWDAVRPKPKRTRVPVGALPALSPKVFEGRAYSVMRYADKVVARQKSGTKESRHIRWRTIVEYHARRTFKRATEEQYSAYRRILRMGMAKRGIARGRTMTRNG